MQTKMNDEPNKVANEQAASSLADQGVSAHPSSASFIPPLLHVGLTAELLGSLQPDSRIVLNLPEGNNIPDVVAGGRGGADDALTQDEEYSLTVTHPSKSDPSSNEIIDYPLMSNSGKNTEWYQALPGPGIKRKLLRMGDTKNRYTLGPTKSELKKMGEKARRRLAEERRKRKEIVRLDDTPFDMSVIAASETAEQRTVQMKAADGAKKVTAIKPKQGSKRRRHDPTVDGWMPNTENLIARATSKDDRSNVVRLHGLPIGVKLEHIRKFFHGLSPSLIFVLPSFQYEFDVWDVTTKFNGKGDAIVKRHPSDFRVFVKFQSHAVADAALERSGESICFEGGIRVCENETVRGAAISISPVSKYHASYLQKHMVSQRLSNCFSL